MEFATDAQGVVDTTSGGGNVDSTSGSTNTATDPIDLTDPDRLIRIKGSDKPVKFGDHVRGFQSEFTKASQRAAQLEKQLQERDARLKQLEQAQRQATQTQRQGGANDAKAALRALPYLTGEEAAQVVEQIEAGQRERDMIHLATLKQLQALQGIVQNLNQSHTTTSFENKISKFVKDAGLNDGWIPQVRRLYLAYEGDDLDQEFPGILSSYVEDIRKLNESERQEKVERARRTPFVPGKGGQTGPSKPLAIKSNSSARDIADELFPLLGGNET